MTKRKIRKILVANRGEIAVRIIRTCKEMGIATVAVYSDADRAMPHVFKADEAYHIGPPPSRQSYLDMERIIQAAGEANADAIHPGYGFLSENADFAERVAQAGLIFIGPRPESIRAMGDKTEARRLVAKAKVPTVPGSPEAISSVEEATSFCKQVGLPVLIKAAAGGGGKGMRIVHETNQLAASFASAQSEALSAFGDGRVYLEKYLERPRHVEFQILADKFGNTIHLGERECSIQRRHQKVIEETPSVIVDEKLREQMGHTAVAAAKACGYENAGTIEFLVDKNGHFFFLEMNTRLQVEHPITEMRTGVDIVEQQIKIAMGEPLTLKQENVTFQGHAIECRIYAEDASNSFFPSTGKITHLRPSQGFGLREDRGIEEGGEISVYYDPIISKLVASGPTRSVTIQRMARALREYEILGVRTNIDFCLFVLQHQKFLEGDFDTHFIENYFHKEKLATTSEEENIAIAAVCAMAESQIREVVFLAESSRDGEASPQSKLGTFNHSRGSKWKRQRIQAMRS